LPPRFASPTKPKNNEDVFRFRRKSSFPVSGVNTFTLKSTNDSEYGKIKQDASNLIQKWKLCKEKSDPNLNRVSVGRILMKGDKINMS
jgi:hypothetical protein